MGAEGGQVKTVTYDKSRILSVSEDGLEYLDDDGCRCRVDFTVCCENVEKEMSSEGWIRVGESDDVYVGFRDWGAKPPYITLATDPPTRFVFPMPGPPVKVPGSQFVRRNPEDYREFRDFQIRLMEAGVTTLDMG